MAEFTWKLLVAVCAAALGSSIQFYHCGVINTPQSIIEAWINQTYYDRGSFISESVLTIIWSVIVSSVPLGALIGSCLTRILVDRLGRRNGLITNGIANVVAGVIVGIAKTTKLPELLIVGRLIFGFNLGTASGIVPIFVTEAAPIKYRGAFGTAHMIAVAFADLLSLVVGLPEILGTDELWPIALALPMVPALIMVLILPFCADSPRYLMMNRKREDLAFDAIKFYIGPDHAEEVFRNLQRECRYVEVYKLRTGNKSYTWTELLRLPEIRTPLLICVMVMIAQQFTGVVAIFSYSTKIFEDTGLDLNAARLSTVGLGAGYFLFTLSAIYSIERAGRRKLSIFQLTGLLVILIAFFITNLVSNLTGGVQTWSSTLSIICLVAFMCVYGAGSPIPWMISSELFNQEHRATAVSISTFVSWFLCFIIATFFLSFQEAVGQTFSFLPFIVVTMFTATSVILFLPETKNKTIDEIVDEFRKRKRTVSMTISRTVNRTITLASMAEKESLISRGSRAKYPSSYQSIADSVIQE